jgi:hypothetical protein
MLRSLTPLPSADTMRFIRREASPRVALRGSAPCVALIGHCRCFLCLVRTSHIHLPARLPSARLCCPRVSRHAPQQYYAGSDSCPASPARQVSPLSRSAFRTSRPQRRCAPERRFASRLSAFGVSSRTQASPSYGRLAALPRRIGFVLLQAIPSLPAAPHPASRRGSCLRLHVLRLHITRTLTTLTERQSRTHHSRRSASAFFDGGRRPPMGEGSGVGGDAPEQK